MADTFNNLDALQPNENAIHAQRLNTVSILVVDDDPDMRDTICAILSEHGYRATACSESRLVISMLREHPVDCVLLDIRMHGLEGSDLLPIIKHHWPRLPVIMVSAYADAEASYFISLGAFDFVTKPFNNKRLIDAIGRAVGTMETIPFVLTNLTINDARDHVYRKLIVTALTRTNWNQTKAAELLGISRYSLMRWVRKLEISL